MITLRPVLERWFADCPFWPVERTDYFLAVPRMPTPPQVGTVMRALIARSVPADDLSMTAAEAINEYLTCDDEDFAPGGLRVGAGDVVIDPGCCAGLGEWRAWLRVAAGEVIFLGHSPDVFVEHRGPVVRVRKDQPSAEPEPHELRDLAAHATDVPGSGLRRGRSTRLRARLQMMTKAGGSWRRNSWWEMSQP